MVVFRHHTREFYFLMLVKVQNCWSRVWRESLIFAETDTEFCFKDFFLTETTTFFQDKIFQNSQKNSKGSTKKNLFF